MEGNDPKKGATIKGVTLIKPERGDSPSLIKSNVYFPDEISNGCAAKFYTKKKEVPE